MPGENGNNNNNHGFFSRVHTPYSSTDGARHAGRANLIVQAASGYSDKLDIATKFSQTGISFYTSLRSDVQTSERLLHLMMAGITATQLALTIILLYDHKDCTTSNSNLCTSLDLLTYLYAGGLILTQTIAEAYKMPKTKSSNNLPADAGQALPDEVEIDMEEEAAQHEMH